MGHRNRNALGWATSGQYNRHYKINERAQPHGLNPLANTERDAMSEVRWCACIQNLQSVFVGYHGGGSVLQDVVIHALWLTSEELITGSIEG